MKNESFKWKESSFIIPYKAIAKYAFNEFVWRI
jgi:hypothetical protein